MIRTAVTLLLFSSMAVGVARADTIDLMFFPNESPESSDGLAMWNAAISAVQNPNRNFDVHLMLSPMAGPGNPSSDNRYIGADGNGLLRTFVESGGKAYGYVSTERGGRAQNLVETDINTYYNSKYGPYMSGIFFDEMADEIDQTPYYESLDNFLRTNHQSNARTFGNIGTPYLNNSSGQSQISFQDLVESLDTIINVEYALTDYLDPTVYQPNAVYSGLAPEQIGHIIHTNPSWDPDLLNIVSARGAGLLYVTDDILEDPYDKTPGYWNQMVDDVIAFNAVPEPSALLLITVASGGLAFWRRDRHI